LLSWIEDLFAVCGATGTTASGQRKVQLRTLRLKGRKQLAGAGINLGEVLKMSLGCCVYRRLLLSILKFLSYQSVGIFNMDFVNSSDKRYKGMIS